MWTHFQGLIGLAAIALLAALMPEQRAAVTNKRAARTAIAGTLATLMTAAVVGLVAPMPS